MINWQASVGRAAKVRLTTQTSFTTTGSPLTTESVGRLRRHLLLAWTGVVRTRKDWSHGRSSAPTSSKRSRNSRTCSSLTAGRSYRHLKPFHRLLGRDEARWPRTWLYRPLQVAAHASEPPPCSICCMASLTCRTNILGKENHGRSHPSHLGSWVFKQLVGRSNEKKPVGAPVAEGTRQGWPRIRLMTPQDAVEQSLN